MLFFNATKHRGTTPVFDALVFVCFIFCLFLTASAKLQDVEWIDRTQWRHVCVYVEAVFHLAPQDPGKQDKPGGT